MKRIIALSGKPGIGKTTLTQKVIEKLQTNGKKCNGFYTQELRKDRERIGFDVVTLDGKTGPLARVHISSEARPRPKMVGKYAVDLESFEHLVLPIFDKEKLKSEDILVLDEIGKMELFSRRFEREISNVLKDEKVIILTTVPLLGGNPIIEQIKKHPQTLYIEITRDNRDDPAILDKIIAILLQK